ncbi:S8 family serine peptidase [Streptomyces sp. TE5632]
MYEVRARASRDVLAASAELHGNDRFVFAEPSFTGHVPARFRPTGARYPRQWQWRNAGTNGGTSDADVRIGSAWDRTFGAGIRVAVIDNGFDAEHPDLAAGVDRLPGFFTDGVEGAVFVQGTSGTPDSDHGTFCAGVVGARLNNGAGRYGRGPRVQPDVAGVPAGPGRYAADARPRRGLCDRSFDGSPRDRPGERGGRPGQQPGPERRGLGSDQHFGTRSRIRRHQRPSGQGNADLLGGEQRQERRHRQGRSGLPSGCDRRGAVDQPGPGGQHGTRCGGGRTTASASSSPKGTRRSRSNWRSG